MKRVFLTLCSLLIIVSFAACSSPADVAQSSPPTASASPIASHAVVPGIYTPDSGCGLYEDEDYIVFKNGYNILVYDKSGKSVQTALRHCSAFTYSEGVIYYSCYESQSGQRCINVYDIKTGEDRTIKKVDNFVPSLLASGGRLYYSYRTDPEDITSNELFSMLPEGGDPRSEGICGLDMFCIADGSIYYTDISDTLSVHSDYGISIYRYSGGTAEKITGKISDPYSFVIMDGRLYYRDSSNYISSYDPATGNTESCVHTNGWSAYYALAGGYITYIESNDNETHSHLRAYSAKTGNNRALQLEGSEYEMYTLGSGAYFSPHTTGGACRLYRVAINEGSPAAEQVFSYDPNEASSADTVIIADSRGGIYGGYSNGQWLTHSEAAGYCVQPIDFSEYNIAGRVGTVKTSGESLSAKSLAAMYILKPLKWTPQYSTRTDIFISI